MMSNRSGRIEALVCALSILIQQSVFLYLTSTRVLFMHISQWVLWAPILLIWIMYFLMPVFYVRPLSVVMVLRSYSRAGWCFVIFAFTWSLMFFVLSERFGTPVSWDQVSRFYNLGKDQHIRDLKQQSNQ